MAALIYAAWKFPKTTENLLIIIGGFMALAGAYSLFFGLSIVGVLFLVWGVACLGAIWLSRRAAAKQAR